ncbi:hypothetical protein [Niallia circulans]|uniref:hypothetical protein n=1 Tax=Niallia circulans TaxID=1397 RepID=UPI00155FFF5E|nr:hypothetical protein [Niallia circulans]NRG30715.1 hypothetical protein [Niallia circulans]
MADKNETSREEIEKELDIAREAKKEHEKSAGNLTVKVDVDISEALTGLKALQREAKKATQVLRELEEAHKIGLTEEEIADAIVAFGNATTRNARLIGDSMSKVESEGDGE